MHSVDDEVREKQSRLRDSLSRSSLTTFTHALCGGILISLLAVVAATHDGGMHHISSFN